MTTASSSATGRTRRGTTYLLPSPAQPPAPGEPAQPPTPGASASAAAAAIAAAAPVAAAAAADTTAAAAATTTKLQAVPYGIGPTLPGGGRPAAYINLLVSTDRVQAIDRALGAAERVRKEEEVATDQPPFPIQRALEAERAEEGDKWSGSDDSDSEEEEVESDRCYDTADFEEESASDNDDDAASDEDAESKSNSNAADQGVGGFTGFAH